ncbi:MAG: M15 family peptidase [Desulfovibrio sp.]|nr:MAG: M15 family peptidase [Desulfovibrio sp.]
MVFRIVSVVLVLGCFGVAWAAPTLHAQEPVAELEADLFQGMYGPLPQTVRENMLRYSWRPGCPVDLEDLRYVTVSYLGFDNEVHVGELVVHKDVAEEVLAIFSDLLAAEFPIERMRLIDHYQGDDGLSMADNNTSAFNCRKATGSDVFSRHSWGMAIDINPLLNPYMKGDVVLPPEGLAYMDRDKTVPGLITAGDACWESFVSRGWQWGGDWNSLKDYQHFETTGP